MVRYGKQSISAAQTSPISTLSSRQKTIVFSSVFNIVFSSVFSGALACGVAKQFIYSFVFPTWVSAAGLNNNNCCNYFSIIISEYYNIQYYDSY